jgi:hypothetical protein
MSVNKILFSPLRTITLLILLRYCESLRIIFYKIWVDKNLQVLESNSFLIFYLQILNSIFLYWKNLLLILKNKFLRIKNISKYFQELSFIQVISEGLPNNLKYANNGHSKLIYNLLINTKKKENLGYHLHHIWRILLT